MSDKDGFIKSVISLLSRALVPLADAIDSPDEFNQLLRELGWYRDTPSTTPSMFASIATNIATLADDANQDAEVAILIEDVVRVMADLDAFRTALDSSLGAPFDNPEFWSSLPEELLGLFLSRIMELERPGIYGLLTLGGVFQKRLINADLSVGREAYQRRLIDWHALAALIASPANQIREVYGWAADFDHVAWLEAMHAVATGLGASASLNSISLKELTPFVSADNPERARLRRLLIAAPSLMGANLSAFVKSALSVFAIPPSDQPAAELEGILIAPILTGAAGSEIPLANSAQLTLTGDFQSSPIRVGVRPEGVALESSQVDIDVAARVDIEPSTPLVLIGSAEGSRFELRQAHLEAAIALSESSSNLSIDFVLDDGQVVIDLTDADGFVRDTLGSSQQTLPLSMGMHWSLANGLQFAGSATPVIRIPVNLTLAGVLSVENLEASLTTLDAGVSELSLALTGGFELGPFALVFEKLGVAVSAQPASFALPGNLGLLDASLGFKPPTGVGLAVNLEVVKGGGFISHDPLIGLYAGAAEFSVFNTGIAAVGVLLTRLPDAPDTWSMFISLAARFVGIQLGFGFTLNGVGGLVGIHRGVDDNALGDAVRSGSLDAILFPEDPVADANRILADIDAIFPPALNQFVFGPVIKIGWGTPTVVEIDVGVAIELPEPLKITLLGVMSAVLPDKDAPVLVLNAAMVAIVNITEGTLALDASLNGSEVAGLSITGDVSVRMEFFGAPNFLVSFGGFHPAYNAPASFPVLNRLGLSLDTGDVLEISLGGYFALSSNSIQFGAFAYLYINELGFTAEGGVSFDALIIFRPFSFAIGLSVWISVSAGSAELLSVKLEGNLTGPNPWHIAAEASFKLLGIKQSIDFAFDIGDSTNQSVVERVDVQALLLEALEIDETWSILSPVGEVPVIASTESEIPAVDPAGRIQLSQRIVPLDTTIDRYGEEQLADADRFTISFVDFKSDELEDLDDYFGAEHYFNLSQDERLSAPSFNLMKAGAVIGSEKTESPTQRSLVYDHEIAYKDAHADASSRVVANAGLHTLNRGLGEFTEIQKQQRFSVRETQYVISDALTGAADAQSTNNSSDYYTARRNLNSTESDLPILVPAYEAELHG